MSQYPLLVQHPLHQYLHLTTGVFAPEQARWDHSGIIEDHQVARAHQLQHIRKLSVFQWAAGAVQTQQPAAAPLLRRITGYELIGQAVGKIMALHRNRTINKSDKVEQRFYKNTPWLWLRAHGYWNRAPLVICGIETSRSSIFPTYCG